MNRITEDHLRVLGDLVGELRTDAEMSDMAAIDAIIGRCAIEIGFFRKFGFEY